MPMAPQLASTGLVLSIALVATAVILGVWQGSERAAREWDLTEVDRRHFAGQDLRRGIVVAVLLILALGIFCGSRMEHLVAGRANLRFVAVWLGVITLIPALLILALSDWLATRRYAQRHRRSLARERIAILRQGRRLAGNRRPSPPFGPDTHQH